MATAQDATYLDKTYESNEKHLNCTYARHLPVSFFVEPPALFPIGNNGAARIGIEFPLSKKHFSLTPVFCLYGNGQGVKGILKYYTNQLEYDRTKHPVWSVHRRYYAALEYYYKAYSYENSDSVTTPPHGERYYHVEKFATTISLQAGCINTFGSGLYWEWFVGGGVRVKTVSNDLADGETDHFYHWHEGVIQNVTDGNVRNAVLPHISLGLRLGWRYR